MSITKLLKSIFIYTALMVLVLVGGLFWVTTNDRGIDYDVDIVGIEVPTFDEQNINHVPTYDAKQTLPFTASAIIDIDGDGIAEIFLGGGIHQADAFYQFKNGAFVDITSQTNWRKNTPDKTFGSVALDLDKDGDTDMLIARQSGVWLYDNSAGKFSGSKLDLEFDSKSVPLSVAVADLNRDGLFDMFVAGYIARNTLKEKRSLTRSMVASVRCISTRVTTVLKI